MKRFTAVVVLIVAPFFFFGCATPKVSYHAEDDINKNYIPFALIASRVTITLPEQAKDGATVDKTVAALGIETPREIEVTDLIKTKIIITPTQAKGTLRYLEPDDSGLSKTNISITYFEAMKVPKSVGVVVEDNTLKAISAIGTVIATVGTIAAAAARPPTIGVVQGDQYPPFTLPIVLDFSDPEDFSTFYKKGKEVCNPIGKPNEKYGYCFTLTERDGRKTTNSKKERYTYKTFFADYDKTFTRHIPFSSCVDLTVTIKRLDKDQKCCTAGSLATYNTIVADPYYVDWLPLPQKGTITSQGICGANSTSEKSDNPGAFDVIEAVGKQVDTVWKAWHPSK